MKTPEQCQYNGANYSHGATICSNHSEFVCNNGQWEPTGKDCGEQISNPNVFVVHTEIPGVHKAFAGCGNGWNTSDAYLISTPNKPPASAVPKIVISEGSITINHAQSGGGSIKQTLLTGTGGNYYLGEGAHHINPGTYTHQIAIGNVVNSGEIHSYVCYK